MSRSILIPNRMDLQDWKRKSLKDLFDAGVTRNPAHTAIVFDNGQRSISLNYEQLQVSSMAVTDELRCNHKCQEEVIGVLVEPSLLLPSVLLGILGVPAAFYTLSMELSAPSRIKHTFERLGIRIVVTDSQELVDRLKAKVFKGCSLTVRSLRILDCELLIVTLLDDVALLRSEDALLGHDLAFAITTSGTTGIPKVVKVPHRCIVPNILHISEIYSLTGADTVLQASPMTFDPSIVEIFTTFFSGATLLMIPDSLKLQPKTLADFAVHRNKVTVLQATPSLISSIASCGVLRLSLLSAQSPMRLLVFGGEPCPNGRTIESWREPGNRTRFINLYGVTEVSSWATYYELTEEDIQSGIEDVPLGSTLLGTELELRGIDNNSVGQLWIGGEDRICLIDDEAQISGRCMRFSGDYVKRTPAGALLYIGRKDDMVKRNGKRLHLHEIEKVCSRMLGIDHCIAIYARNKLILFVRPSLPNELKQDLFDKETAEDNPDRGRQQSFNDSDSDVSSSLKDEGQMFTVPRKDDEAKADVEKKLLVIIWKLVYDWLPYFSHPDDVRFVWNMPLTSHGKVDKRRLLEMYTKSEELIPSGPHLLTEVEISDQVTRIWKKYITSDLPEAKSFVESGGTSVMAVAMTEDVHRLFDVDSGSLLDVLLHGTLQNVINHVLLAFRSTDEFTKSNSECDSGDAVEDISTESVTPLMLQYPTNDSVNLEQRNLKHTTSFDLPPNKRIRKDDIKDCINYSPMENIALDFSDVSDLARTDAAAALSIQRGARYICNEELVHSHLKSSTPSVKDVLVKPTVEMEVCWKYDTGKCVDASPLIVTFRNRETIVYIGSHSHRFVALNVLSGSVLWEVTLGDRIESSACLSHCARYVIVCCYDGKAYFLERLTGRQHWSFQTGSQVKSSPCNNPTNGLVYIGSHDHHLYALNAQMRSCAWKTDLGGASIFSSPLMNSLTYEVVVATLGGRLVSLHPDSGDVLWQFNAGKPIFSSVAYTEGRYVVGCVDGAVYCIGRDGNKIWNYTTEGAVFSSPCVSEVVLPKHSTQQALHASDSYKTKHLTESTFLNDSPLQSTFVSRKTEDNPNNRPQFVETDSFENNPSDKLSRKVITIGCHDSKVYCLCANSGHLVWSKSLDSAVFSTPFAFSLQLSSANQPISSHSEFTHLSSEVTDSVAVCGSKGVLYILDLAAGIVCGKFHFPGELFSSPCVVGDRLIVGCRNNFVYCVKLHTFYGTS